MMRNKPNTWREHSDADKLLAIVGMEHEAFAESPACVCWPLALDRNGYGTFVSASGGRYEPAHRAAFRLFVGPILPGQVVRHTCDEPSCVAPPHLRAGSHADNVRDRVRRGRSARGERSGRAKLTAASVLAMREAHAKGARVSDLARAHGVSWKAAKLAITGETWAHLKGAP